MSARRRAVRSRTMLLALAAAVLLAGCGAGGRDAGDGHGGGSTLQATWRDASGDGVLRRGPGEPLRARTELAPAAPATATLTRFAQVTDAHVRDAESPARVPFLDRLGGSFASTFRPQETLTTQVLSAAVDALDRMPLDAVVETGDLIDDDQSNELTAALAVLHGGRVTPDSGAPGYDGPQLASDPDPFYYRPDVDPPRHPKLLASAMRPFLSAGLHAPWYPLIGNHDVLVQGVLAPNAATRAAAVGGRALWEAPHGIAVPPNGSAGAPDLAALAPSTAAELLARANVPVAPDPRRRELAPDETSARLVASARHGARDGGWLQYGFDLGSSARGIVLDLVDRAGGSQGVVGAAQLALLRRQLAAAGDRWVVVFTHQPLTSARGGQAALALLDRDPHVVAAVNGDTHRNRIRPRETAAGGYWLISTSSLVDYPQQARAFALRASRGGGVELDTWMVDHDDGTGGLARSSRELAHLDAQGGRPNGFAGSESDRNVRLFKGPPR
jgi:3',5'-cyclic AMP phosphodiesterase CpdA